MNVDITIGPNAFFWQLDRIRSFYETVAKSKASRVVLGEWVCSKRMPFTQDELAQAAANLAASGKQVALASLALITLKRERKLSKCLVDAGLPIEINDFTALAYIPEGTAFWVGPLANVYNEGTLLWLAKRGASRICLPPELPLESIRRLASAAASEGVELEVWGHGRVPLAISGRCYHARLHDRSKDNCQFVCGDDTDGRAVETLDGEKFLTINGVQTLGYSTTTVARQIEDLRIANIHSIRISPHTGPFAEVVDLYAEALSVSGKATLPADLAAIMPNAVFSDGFVRGVAGRAF